MSIKAVEFSVWFEGVEIKTREELMDLMRKVEEVCKFVHPNYQFSTDVTVDVETTAGSFD